MIWVENLFSVFSQQNAFMIVNMAKSWVGFVSVNADTFNGKFPISPPPPFKKIFLCQECDYDRKYDYGNNKRLITTTYLQIKHFFNKTYLALYSDVTSTHKQFPHIDQKPFLASTDRNKKKGGGETCARDFVNHLRF